MAKKKKNKVKKGGKKAKRKAQGRKLARYNKLRAKIGKKAAHAQIFGSHKAAKKGGKKGKKGHKWHKRSKNISSTRRRLEAQALRLIKERYGTEKVAATPAEIRAAQIFVSRTYGMKDPRRGRKIVDAEENRREAFQRKLAKEKRAEAARRVRLRLEREKREEAEEKRKRAEADEEARINAEASRL